MWRLSVPRVTRQVRQHICKPPLLPDSLSAISSDILRRSPARRRRAYFCTDTGTSSTDGAAPQFTVPHPSRIRNFAVVAHIDHGKTTLSNELLRLTGTWKQSEVEVQDGPAAGQSSNNSGGSYSDSRQVLDGLRVERERGITVKARATTMLFSDDREKGSKGDLVEPSSTPFWLNLIDTPGHVDFHYEVSRALAACQGAILVVDASQGVQAQTVANFYLALEADLAIIPVINKIDSPTADVPKVLAELKLTFDFRPSDVICVSARTGDNVAAILPALVDRIPPPPADPTQPFKALLFDSYYDQFRGVICLLEIMAGSLKKGDQVLLASTALADRTTHAVKPFEVSEVGIMHPHREPTEELGAGQVGYLICGMRDTTQARAGDTVFRFGEQVSALPGFKPARAALFAGLYPSDPAQLEKLSEAVEKLRLTDAAISVQKESSDALGTGFRIGFMGLLHMDVFSQRLEQEYGLEVINTAPTVPYRVVLRDPAGGEDEVIQITRPSEYSELVDDHSTKHRVKDVFEPLVRATIIIPEEYMGSVLKLCHDRRAEQLDCLYLDGVPQRVRTQWNIPASEVITNFVDRLQSLTSGYATFEYEDAGYQSVSLSRLRILLNGEECDPLSCLVPSDRSVREGRAITSRLMELIPRQLFQVAVQAAVGSKIVARETVKPLRKNVTAKCYGGDVTRKRKLLEKQKEGKKRMKTFGNVELSTDTFVQVLKRD